MKTLTTWAIITFTLAGMFTLYAGWAYGYLLTRSVLTERDNAAQELEQLSGQDDHTRGLNILIRDTKEQREALSPLIFTADLLGAIQMIEEVAAAAGADVNVTFVGQGEQQVGSILAIAPIVFELTGSFRNIFGAITLLETTPYLASISQMRIEEMPGDDDWIATIRLDTGYIENRKAESDDGLLLPVSSENL